jgi:signal transduction histidine kinase
VDLTWLLLGIRRGAIVLILLLGYLYFKIAGEAYALVSIGLISFAAVAQFAPVALGGLFWKGGSRNGALAGLLVGFAVWFYTLLVPALARSGWLPIEIMQHGLFGFELLRPLQLFGLAGLDQITHSMIWSMIANMGAYVLVSLAGRQSAEEHHQANLFVDVFKRDADRTRFWRGTAQAPALHGMLSRFLSEAGANESFARYARLKGLRWPEEELVADGELVHYVETQLAGAIGAASARIMMASTVQEDALTLEDVHEVLTEAQQVVMYSQQLEQKSKELEAATAELKNANERLQELDRMKDDFVSTVSHELRTPLTSIRAFSEILRENPEIDLTERKRFLDIISKESERLTRLINQVLDLAKIESGKLEWNVSEVDLREAITDSVNATSQLFHEKAVRVDVHMPEHVPRVTTDFDRIIQVLINLLSNAGKFCDPVHGRVEVRLTHEGGKLRVDVRDNGKGISPRDQAIIFEKFGQAGDTLTDKPQGTGLGLPISRQIVEHFGGRLWVESALGKGATFSFTLPIETTEPAEEELLARLAQ